MTPHTDEIAKAEERANRASIQPDGCGGIIYGLLFTWILIAASVLCIMAVLR